MINKDTIQKILESGVPLILVNAVIKRVGGVLAFEPSAAAIAAEPGLISTLAGFHDYLSNVAFGEAYQPAILHLALAEAREQNVSVYALPRIVKYLNEPVPCESTVAEMIHLPWHSEHNQAYNALALYALERVVMAINEANRE